jgi:hypothetical protein
MTTAGGTVRCRVMNKTGSSKRRFITYALATATATLTLAGPASATHLGDSLLPWSSTIEIQTTSQTQETDTSSTVHPLVLQQMMEHQTAQYTQLSNLAQSMYYTQVGLVSNLR